MNAVALRARTVLAVVKVRSAGSSTIFDLPCRFAHGALNARRERLPFLQTLSWLSAHARERFFVVRSGHLSLLLWDGQYMSFGL